MYRSSYIKSFDESWYLNYLSNPEYLKNLEMHYLNKYTDKSDAWFLAFKESLDHYVLKKCHDDKDFINSNQFKNYCEYLKNIFEKTIINYKNKAYYPELTNNVFLSNYNMSKLFADKTGVNLAILESIHNQNSSERKRICMAMKEHKSLTQEEVRFISDYIYSSRDDDENLINTYLEYMFNDLDKSIVSEPAITGAILTCCAFVYKNDKKVNKESRFYVAEKDYKKDVNVAHSNPLYRYCVFQKSYLDTLDLHSANSLSNSRSFKFNDLYWLVFAAFHELTHQHQNNEANKNNYSSSGLSTSIRNILIEYLPKKKYANGCVFTDYSINHDADETEMEADEEGWNQLDGFIHKYLRLENKYIDVDDNKESKSVLAYHNALAVKRRRTFSMKEDKKHSSGKKYFATYDMENLLSIVKKHPEALNMAPNLKCFFNDDGSFNPIRVLSSNLLRSNDGTTRHNNNSAYELCVEAVKHSNEIYEHIDSNGITESEAKNLLESLQYVCYGGKHKFEDFISIVSAELRSFFSTDIDQYNETHSRFNFTYTKEINECFIYHYSTIIYAIIAERKLYELIKHKYPKYELSPSETSDYQYYILNPIERVLNNAQANDSIAINLLKNPKLQELMNKAKNLNIKELNASIDYYIEKINQINENTMQQEQKGRSR